MYNMASVTSSVSAPGVMTSASSLYGGANAPDSWAFNDAANDLNPQYSIKMIELIAGWTVAGIR
jgi:hypothetical protein